MPLLRSQRGHVVLDIVLVAWAIVWIYVGVTIAVDIRGLSTLSTTVSSVGRAVQDTGALLRSLDGLPLVGDRLAEPATSIERAGRQAVASAEASRRNAHRVGVLVGLSIAIIPTLPVLVLYVPERLVFARDRRAVRRALARREDSALDEVLALRAVTGMPYHRLRDVSADPARDLADGRHGALAEAELVRLGLRRPTRGRR